MEIPPLDELIDISKKRLTQLEETLTADFDGEETIVADFDDDLPVADLWPYPTDSLDD